MVSSSHRSFTPKPATVRSGQRTILYRNRPEMPLSPHLTNGHTMYRPSGGHHPLSGRKSIRANRWDRKTPNGTVVHNRTPRSVDRSSCGNRASSYVHFLAVASIARPQCPISISKLCSPGYPVKVWRAESE